MGPVEDALLRRYLERGDLAAREELVVRLRPIVRRLARRYRHSGHVEDLEQAAGLGLTKALDRFDPTFGADLICYAVPTMAGEVRRWLRDHSWAVRPPREAAETWLEVAAASERLAAALGHTPSAGELACDLNLPIERVLAAFEARRGRFAISLDAPARTDGDERTVGEGLGADDDELRHAFERAWLSELGALLNPLERQVVEMSFTEDLSQREIARRLELSQMKVCRVLRRAMERLREADAGLVTAA
ncbi:MAG: sigma-70 family RNA polymerase sigma factor [Actinomycetota bacterium]|nr:sigma-70 family RNA polymerase sigma factor [Actinomycetota bacterium]